MEYNENKNFENNNVPAQEPVILQEKGSSHKGLWYWVIAILLLGLLGWYGYTAGWFVKNTTNMIPVDSNNGISNDTKSLEELAQGIKAPIDNIIINTSESFPVQKTLSIKGNLADGCTYLNDPQIIRDGNAFYINLTTYQQGNTCTQALVPYERNIGLDVVGLPAGVYRVIVNGKETTFELEQDNSLDFSAGEEK